MVGFQILIRAAFRRVGAYYYIFPTFSQGRRILWDALTSDGSRVLDFIPPEVVESRNEQQMRIKLINGSLIQVIGSDNFDNTLIGTNPLGCLFSEYALQSPEVYTYVKPILAYNNGFAIFLSTPRSKNHLYDLWQIALQNPDVWYSNMLTVKDTKHISEAEIQADIERGEISWELAQQEYMCSFDLGQAGSVYAVALDRMKLNNQFDNVPWQPQYKVNTAWDIGLDMTSIIFFQCIGQVVNVIDYYENSGQNLEHYVNVLNEKKYTYGRHNFPHDMAHREWAGPRYTRIEKARQLGIKAYVVDDVGLADGIEFCKSQMPRIWIDSTKCAKLIKALENYTYEYDRRLNRYKDKPIHNLASHGSDSFRYMCLSLPTIKDSMTQADADKFKQEALYNEPRIAPVFQQPNHGPWF